MTAQLKPQRSSARPAVLAWSLCALTLTTAVVAGVLLAEIGDTDWAAILPAAEPPSEGVALSILDIAWLTAFAVVGALVASHRPRNPIGWFLGAIPAFMAFLSLGEGVYWHTARTHPRAPGLVAELGLWLANVWWVPAVILIFVFLPLLFPTGSPPTPRWRIVAWAAGAGGVVLFVGSAFDPGPLDNYAWVDNPLGIAGMPAVVAWVGVGVWMGTSLLAVASVVVRFRRSRGAERQQLKWFTAAVAQLVAVFAGSSLLQPVIGEAASWGLVATGFLCVAVEVAMGILRYRLYDIDVVVNRALVYGGLTATLAATYLGSVLVLQLALSGLTGNSGLAVTASTLAVAALFRPARARFQAVVDRHFYRRKYDAQRTLEAFAGRLRDEVALDALEAELRGVVQSTMQPAQVSLWLRAPDSGPGRGRSRTAAEGDRRRARA
jgi:hypothetical protein